MESETPSSTPPSSRQTVQVIQQTLSRQPSTAAQYLQQMYAAQQQHLMLQTAALQQQQQHLNSTQLQSLAAAQQASLAVSRSSPAVIGSQPSPTQVTTIIQRPQTSSAAAAPTSAITQQAVLLGNAPSPALSASQAQMYLRAQMLIFTPTATVSSIQSDVSSAATSSQAPPISTQVQNLTTKPARSICSYPRGETPTALTAHSIITPAYSPQLVQEPKPIVHQFVIQSQPHVQTRPVLPLAPLNSALQPLTHQPQVSQGLSSPPVTSQAPLEPERQRPGPVLSLPQQNPGPDGAAQCRLLPSGSAVILQIPGTPPADHLLKHCDRQVPPAATPLSHSSEQHAATPLSHSSEQHAATPRDCSPPGRCSTEAPPPLDMTSGNGSSPLPAAATGSAPQNGDYRPPQAVIRPQILTHIIEGFVIQEGPQPFPQQRSGAALEAGRSSSLAGAPEKGQQHNTATTTVTAITATTDSELEEPAVPEAEADGDPPKLKCELCGRVDFEYKFKRSKRFCSMACAKRYNVGCTKRVGLFQPDRSKVQKPVGGAAPTRRRVQRASLTHPATNSITQVSGCVAPSSPVPPPASSILKHPNSREDSSRCSDNSSYEEPLSPASASSSLSRHRHSNREQEVTQLHPGSTLLNNHNFLPSDPTKWNVEDVYEFIRSLPGCQEVSEEFRLQEIDGQALLLLKEDHLMSAMNIKLGPALKIYARISMLRDS